MAIERKEYIYTPFTPSETLTGTGTKKTDAETAYDTHVTNGYTPSEAVTNAGTKKTDAEGAYNTHFANGFTFSQGDAFNDTMNKILNREKFSYDVNGDALYQQYKDKYIQQGKMAMADTMGQAAAMTGGYGNSYAASVGNQAYQASLQNLNDIIPQLYQMAYDRYNQEGQDLYNQYGMLSNERSTEYGMWTDEGNRYANDRTYYSNAYDSAYNKDYGAWVDRGTMLNNNRTYWGTEYDSAYGREFDEHTVTEGYKYQDVADANAFAQWKANYDETQRQFDETMAFNTAQAGATRNDNGTYTVPEEASAPTLWYATGTYDDNGNPVFRNSEGKTQAYGEGINPYTGSKHPDAKHGTFSNGYQPNNIGGTKLKKSGMSTNITGKNQTIWTANGKYYLWRGDLNQYIEVDVSDLD